MAHTPPGAGTPAELPVVALFDQIDGSLDTLVKEAREDLAEGWDPIRLVDVLAMEMYNSTKATDEAGDDGLIAQASLLAVAVLRLARQSAADPGEAGR